MLTRIPSSRRRRRWRPRGRSSAARTNGATSARSRAATRGMTILGAADAAATPAPRRARSIGPRKRGDAVPASRRRCSAARRGSRMRSTSSVRASVKRRPAGSSSRRATRASRRRCRPLRRASLASSSEAASAVACRASVSSVSLNTGAAVTLGAYRRRPQRPRGPPAADGAFPLRLGHHEGLMTPLAPLHVDGATADAALDAFLAWVADQGLTLHPAQEEALVEVFAGAHVVLNTPTGSGKSLVALGAHVAALASGRRTFYTAPVKALVSEKFFALCAQLGAARVGMLTGDATINPGAPVVCATAEIVANHALRYGADAPVDQVVMDEFHFYGDPDRGWAWQVPLLELTGAQFLLMSATLGDTRRIEEGLRRRTGRPVAVVRSATRPVPLRFEYRRTPLHETIESLLAADQAPLYVVHFTQAAAVAQGQALTSAAVTTRAQREAIAAAVADFRFAPGFGQTLSRLVRHGIGVHHGGMLPKYRRLVERLTQAGHLRVVAGTDTLGVGVNLPLRTVVFTGLAKYDGTTSRLLSAREFHQIAGRAGRAGYDTTGLVVVQAPEHVIENERAVEKAAGDPKKLRKIVRSQPPRGFVPWDQATFDRLVRSPPEPLASQFRVTHAAVLAVLDRPGNGCAALRRLLVDNDEPRVEQRRHIRRTIAIYRSLVASGALQRLDEPDEQGRWVRVTTDLQEDFALD